MDRNLFTPAAEVRPAVDLSALAASINRHHEAGEVAARKGIEHYRAAGKELLKAKEACGHGNWLAWLERNVKFTERQARRYMALAKTDVTSDLDDQWRIISGNAPEPLVEDFEAPASLLYEPEDQPAPEERREVADRLRDAGFSNEHFPPARVPLETVGDSIREAETALAEKYVSLETWTNTGASQRLRSLSAGGDSKFNYQGDNASIEWALWSWNPVTGCLHNCPYCYARDIATLGPTARAFPNGFTPTIIPGRLRAPVITPFPDDKIAAEPPTSWRRRGLGNVFTCSMADLFGRWVPAEWIEAVLDAVRAAPQWNFLFLTKFPIRMADFDFPGNAWVGTTVDCQARVANAERAFRKIKAGVKWLSCEPLIEPLRFDDLSAFDWLVIGGASHSAQTPAWTPPLRWVVDLEDAAVRAGVPFYEKSNLGARTERVRQYPGDEPHRDAIIAPDALRYLPTPESKEGAGRA